MLVHSSVTPILRPPVPFCHPFHIPGWGDAGVKIIIELYYLNLVFKGLDEVPDAV